MFTLSTPCNLSIHNNICKCSLKCSLTLCYGVSGVCALDFVSLERGNVARKRSRARGAVRGAEKEAVSESLWFL